MADDPNDAKHSGADVFAGLLAARGGAADWPQDWAYFLQNPSWRARRNADEQLQREQQAVDEQRQQAVDEQREHELKLANKQHMVPAWEGKTERRQREVAIYMKAAETVVTPGAPRKMAWKFAGAALDQANKLLARDKDFDFDLLDNRDPIYRVIRIPSNWSRLTSLKR
jgi:hypothetical protein